MAFKFKRVLSAIMVVLVVISTLCAFKPAEAKIEPIITNETNIEAPNVSFDFSFNSLMGSLTVAWDGGYETYTGGKGESDQVRTLSTITHKPVEYPKGMFKYNFLIDEGVYTTTFYTITVYDNLRDFPNGPIKSYYSLRPYVDHDSQTNDMLDIFVDNDDYIYIASHNTEVTSTTSNKFDVNVYVNYSTLGRQYSDGFDVGYDRGYDDGVKNNIYFDQGYNKGRADGIASGFYGLFTDPLGSLFNFMIVPFPDGGGITLGSIFLVLIAISLIVIYLKYFAGG